MLEGVRSYSGLGLESLPEYFRDLAAIHGDKVNTRAFIESYRTKHYPSHKEQYQFLLSSQLIKNMKSLLLDGDDPLYLYTNRHCDFSCFSLAPLSEASMDTMAHKYMLVYEQTEANHGPT